MSKLFLSCSAAALALSLIACVAEDASPNDNDEQTSQVSSDLVVGAHYCVDQSTASAFRTDNFQGPFQCDQLSTTLPINTQLSQGHPVKVVRNCVDPTYVNVLSLWTGSFYMMRASALSPC